MRSICQPSWRCALERFQFSLKQGYRQCPESAEGVAGYWRSNINWKRFNPDLKKKYQDLKDAGKPSKVAITAVMRKLLILARAC